MLQHLTDEMILAAIRSMSDDVFDSHALLQTLATQQPHEYVRELAAKLHTDDPILQAHSDIASQLNRAAFQSVVEKSRRSASENIRGKITDNQVWRRI